ncbi:MAG: CPXCG motif-containing cysteine-rich protein [Verrucomicrobiota bacterium]
MNTYPVTCPTCFETFEIAVPPESEMPTEYDYDCEVCCRPMLIILNSSNDIYAQSLAD